VTTAPGGFINVVVAGREDAALVNGPTGGGNGCSVELYGPDRQSADLGIDAAGNGSVRFGPLRPGDYVLTGKCNSRASVRNNLFASERVDVVLDGGAAVSGPPVPAPPVPLTPSQPGQSLESYCNGMAGITDAIGLAGGVVFLIPGVGQAPGAIIGGAGVLASSAIRLFCADAATRIGDGVTAVRQGCDTFVDLVLAAAESRLKGVDLGGLPVGDILKSFAPGLCEF
jgi:hypothetical protein